MLHRGCAATHQLAGLRAFSPDFPPFLVSTRRARLCAGLQFANAHQRWSFSDSTASRAPHGANDGGRGASSQFVGGLSLSTPRTRTAMSVQGTRGAMFSPRLVPSLDLTACSRAQRVRRRLSSTRRASAHSGRAEKLRGERSDFFGSGWHLDLAAVMRLKK